MVRVWTEGRNWEAAPLDERDHILGRGELVPRVASVRVLIVLVAIATLLPGEYKSPVVDPSRDEASEPVASIGAIDHLPGTQRLEESFPRHTHRSLLRTRHALLKRPRRL